MNSPMLTTSKLRNFHKILALPPSCVLLHSLKVNSLTLKIMLCFWLFRLNINRQSIISVLNIVIVYYSLIDISSYNYTIISLVTLYRVT